MSDHSLRLDRSLPRPGRRVLGGAVAVFAAVGLVYYTPLTGLRTDAIQLPLTAFAVLAVGFAVAGDDARPRPSALACALGGLLCVAFVTYEDTKRGPTHWTVVAASAVVLPALFGALGALGAFARRVGARLWRIDALRGV